MTISGLKEGKFKASDEDFKAQIERFNEMDYPRQIQLVRDIIQAQEVRLSKTLPGSEEPVSYTHLRAHETEADVVCRLLLEKTKREFLQK